ncbi:MAG: hypothetical protein VX278_04345, partial [Myxococcota bacterium]|nr:hypothetical protein [Myxococcota bacterium]
SLCHKLANQEQTPRAATPKTEELHFLSEMIWSPIPPVQVLAIRICKKLNLFPSMLEDLYLSPEIAERL